MEVCNENNILWKKEGEDDWQQVDNVGDSIEDHIKKMAAENLEYTHEEQNQPLKNDSIIVDKDKISNEKLSRLSSTPNIMTKLFEILSKFKNCKDAKCNVRNNMIFCLRNDPCTDIAKFEGMEKTLLFARAVNPSSDTGSAPKQPTTAENKCMVDKIKELNPAIVVITVKKHGLIICNTVSINNFF